MEQMFVVGKIVNTHGLKGEVKVYPTTDDEKKFEKLKEVYVSQKQLKKFTIESVRYHKKMVLIKFKEINSIEEAELLKNAVLKIERKDALQLQENEYYISDLYGMKISTQEGRELGTLIDILYTGSNDVYVVENEETKKQILLPAIHQVIKQVDIEKNVMIVSLLEGLE